MLQTKCVPLRENVLHFSEIRIVFLVVEALNILRNIGNPDEKIVQILQITNIMRILFDTSV